MAGRWDREFHQPGNGDARLFYAVFGDFGAEFALESSKYRSSGPPAGTELTLYTRAEHGDFLKTLYQGYLGKVLHELGLAEAVESSPACAILHGEVEDPTTLDYFRDAIGLVQALLDAGGVAVLDSFALHWWTPEDWREEVFEPNGPQPNLHVALLASPDPKGFWLHTRGMRKYGRPDLSIRGLHEKDVELFAGFFEAVIEQLAGGAVIPDGQRMRLAGTKAEVVSQLVGSVDDPDFNNVHYELTRSA